MGIQHSRFDLVMTEQLLNHAEIDTRFEQMCRETVPQRVHADTLVDARLATGPFEKLAWRGHVVPLVRRCSRKEQRFWPELAPILPQQFEEFRRQPCVAILLPLA